MKLLAAIPCYNEALTIGSVALKAQQHVDDVLVVDDGSSDATTEITKAAGAHVITHDKNKGKGAAVKTALRYAAANDFDALVLLDGDGQHDPAQIPQLLQPIQEGRADIVIGYRELTQMPRYRRVGRFVLDYTTAAGKLTKDTQSGFRALSRQAIEALQANHLHANDFSIESEMIMVARDLQLTVAEVPITCNYALKNTSTENPVKHGFGVLGSIINVIAEKRPLLYIGVPGLALIMIGFYFGLTLLRQYNQAGYFSLPFTLLAGFFIIVGVLGVFISLVLNLISRVLRAHEEERQ